MIYFILTAIANMVLNYYLLHIVEETNARNFANKYGLIHFYFVTILTGWIVIPIVIITIFLALISKK